MDFQGEVRTVKSPLYHTASGLTPLRAVRSTAAARVSKYKFSVLRLEIGIRVF